MIITSKLKMDLQKPGVTPILHAVQSDCYSRNVEIAMYSGGLPFTVPEQAAAVIRYRKSDGKGGEYDTLPDGTPAWKGRGNILTIALAPQVLTAPGSVALSVSLMEGESLLTVFPIHIAVQPVAAAQFAESENYFNITGLLPAPAGAKTGQYLQVAAVNGEGRVTAVAAVDLPAGPGGYAQAETDPTVPDWAKQPRKPEYNAQEVGADAAGTAAAAITAHNEDALAHADIRQLISRLPEPETGGQAGPAVFYVTVTGANGQYTVDKTMTEITAAYESGQQVSCIFTGTESDSGTENLIMPLLIHQEEAAFFGTYVDGFSWAVICMGESAQAVVKQMASFEDIPKTLPNPCRLTFTGAVTGTYDGTQDLTIAIPESSGTGGADGYTPVRGVDYWTEADQEAMVQQVLAALGTPVFGTVDEDNNIILTGALADGTYILKYEDADGRQILIGTLENVDYVNRLNQAIDAIGTAYNGGQGWKTGFRLNSSGAEAALEGMEVTGFIPCAYGDTVYLRGIGWDIDSGNTSQTYVWAYDAGFNPLAYAIAVDFQNGTNAFPSSASADGNGCLTKFVVDDGFFANLKSGSLSNAAYFRLNCESITGDSVITVNQSIT